MNDTADKVAELETRVQELEERNDTLATAFQIVVRQLRINNIPMPNAFLGHDEISDEVKDLLNPDN